MIGTILSNRYEIIEQIGMGGMAIVYKAKCRLLNRYVAIKVLRDEYKVDSEFVKKFNIESQAAASLSNPNIVSVYDVGHDGDCYYIVMELVEGITLKEYIEKSGMLNWRLALKFAIQICSALHHAHKNGIIHRDIKPHNIILTKEGVCKVTDFGIARATNMNETRNIEDGIMGSVHYISPEHAKGVITDARSDIYSLGVSIYEMLTSKLPFDGDSAVSIAIMHLNQTPIAIKDINIAVPLGFVQIVEKAMAKDINLRYQSAKEMLDDLESLSTDPEVFVPQNTQALYLGNTRLISKDEHEDIKKQIENITTSDEKEELSKKGKKKKKKKRIFKNLFSTNTKQDKVAVIAAVITSIILLGAVSVIALNLFAPDFMSLFSSTKKEIEMPNFEGKVLEEIEEEYKKKKITFIVEEEVYNNEFLEGQIISQKPAYGINVKLPLKVKVIISKGSKEIELPRFIDKEYRQAQLELTNLGLTVNQIEVFNDEVPKGYVINQSPLPNTTVKYGDEITLTVSKGIDSALATVPKLIDLTESDAKSKIKSAGLVLGGVIRENSSKPAGTVIKQSITEGSEVSKDSKITITVSTGKEDSTPTPSANPSTPTPTTQTPTSTPASTKPATPTPSPTSNSVPPGI